MKIVYYFVLLRCILYRILYNNIIFKDKNVTKKYGMLIV